MKKKNVGEIFFGYFFGGKDFFMWNYYRKHFCHKIFVSWNLFQDNCFRKKISGNFFLETFFQEIFFWEFILEFLFHEFFWGDIFFPGDLISPSVLSELWVNIKQVMYTLSFYLLICNYLNKFHIVFPWGQPNGKIETAQKH